MRFDGSLFDELLVRFDPRPGSEAPHTVRYTPGEAQRQLVHAFALTVHKVGSAGGACV